MSSAMSQPKSISPRYNPLNESLVSLFEGGLQSSTITQRFPSAALSQEDLRQKVTTCIEEALEIIDDDLESDFDDDDEVFVYGQCHRLQ